MKTTIDNSQRRFLVQSLTDSRKDVFCNLQDIPFILSEYFEPNEPHKVYEFWNRKLKVVSKKFLKQLFEANKIDGQIVKTIHINALEWFDKVNGNRYFAATVTINAGYKSEQEIKVPFQYGYGDHFKSQCFAALEEAGILKGVRKYESGGSESLWGYCDRRGIVLTTRKHENCKKSDLKNI